MNIYKNILILIFAVSVISCGGKKTSLAEDISNNPLFMSSVNSLLKNMTFTQAQSNVDKAEELINNPNVTPFLLGQNFTPDQIKQMQVIANRMMSEVQTLKASGKLGTYLLSKPGSTLGANLEKDASALLELFVSKNYVIPPNSGVPEFAFIKAGGLKPLLDVYSKLSSSSNTDPCQRTVVENILNVVERPIHLPNANSEIRKSLCLK